MVLLADSFACLGRCDMADSLVLSSSSFSSETELPRKFDDVPVDSRYTRAETRDLVVTEGFEI